MAYNEYGTLVSVHICGEAVCGGAFTVCPATPADRFGDTFGDGCLAEGCPSYDISRDVGLFWDVDPDIVRVPIASNVNQEQGEK
jgi:hypothetical protein